MIAALPLPASRMDEPRDAEPHRPLTDRQLQVAEMLAAGLTRQEIADTLGISLGAVKRHLENIALVLDGGGSLRVRIVRYVLRRMV